MIFFAPANVVTLAAALATAQGTQPSLRQARAQTVAARARADEARAPLLPQVTATATYQRTTANFVARPGVLPRNLSGAATGASGDTFNFFNFGLTLSQLFCDFGQTWNKWRAALSNAEAQAASERASRLAVAADVRTAYFGARAQKSMVGVARETLANQERHLAQITAFVQVGTRPEIDLAQTRTDRANAKVQLINAENAYETAKAQLNLAMGVEGPTDYDVGDETLPAVEGEDRSTEEQLLEARGARPELASLDQQVRAQESTLRAQKGGFAPTFSGTTSLTEGGVDLDNLVWNWNALVSVNWPLFQGLTTLRQVAEARANLEALGAQRDGLRQQIRLELDQARLAVRAAKGALVASDEALTAARERLRLAEGRYQAGVGNVIELGDAQLAATSAAAQRVQAEYNLASARAQLLKALGRP